MSILSQPHFHNEIAALARLEQIVWQNGLRCLPRIERVNEPEATLCLCGCGEMATIGEDVSERLDIGPAQLRVLVTRRPRYACRRCSGAVVQAHATEHVVPGVLPNEALIAEIVVSKLGDHLPLR